MNTERHVTPEGSGAAFRPHPPDKKGDGGGTAKNATVHGGHLMVPARRCPLADIPQRFGKWNSIHQHFRGSAKRGVFDRIHRELRGEVDLECAMIDGAVVQAHRKASGAGKTLGGRIIGRPRGGLTIQIPVLADALGRLVDPPRSPTKHTGWRASIPA